MYFRVWIEGLEEYEPYRQSVEQAAHGRSFPFNAWFGGQDRVYLPLMNVEKDEETKKLIADLNDAFMPSHYKVLDIIGGYATTYYGPTRLISPYDKNKVNIGRLLNTIEKQDAQELESQRGSMSELRYQERLRRNKDYFEDLRKRFENALIRKQGRYTVVISKNIHDIGAMSTGRGWTSCMNLKGGGHSTDVFREVAKGGFVAYLIHSNDMEIKNPVARIHIRRFDNKSGKSIAIPEGSTYPEDVPGFKETVQQWIDSKQGRINPGPYTKQGGKWSDTFSKTHFVTPESPKHIMQWVLKWIDMPPGDQNKYKKYFFHAMDAFLKSSAKFPDYFIELVKSSILGVAEEYLPRFALKYPKKINRQEFEKAFSRAKNSYWSRGIQPLSQLAAAFPQYMTDELLASIEDHRIKEKIVKDNPKLTSALRTDITNDIMDNFSVDNPEFNLRDDEGSTIYTILGKVQSKCNTLHSFKPIPEPLIRKVVEFGRNIGKLNLINSIQKNTSNQIIKDGSLAHEEDIKYQMLQQIIHAFAMTDSDTPTVQRFYRDLLPHWSDLGGISQFGWALTRLKENGKQFLPFLESKREEIQKLYNDYLDNPKEFNSRFFALSSFANREFQNCLESYDYVIDSLSNGTGRSDKHTFDHGNQLEMRMARESRKAAIDALNHLVFKQR